MTESVDLENMDLDEAEAEQTAEAPEDIVPEASEVMPESEIPPNHTEESPKVQAQEANNETETSEENSDAPNRGSKLSEADQVLKEISKYFSDLNDKLTIRELQKNLYLEGKVKKPYYTKWVGEANGYFTQLVRLKRRSDKIKKSKTAA